YVSLVATGTNLVLANPALPAKSFRELVALARSKPNTIRYASSGIASPSHLTMELLQNSTGMQLLHVPYKGGPPSITAAVTGEVQLTLTSLAPAMPMIQAKRLNALAVTSIKRIGALPDVPTVAESGFPGFDVPSTFGILAPAGTPAAVIKLLNAEIRNTLQM